MKSSLRSFSLIGIIVLLASAFGGVTPTSAQTPTILINEVDADTPGTDSAEFLELYDGGVGNTDLTGLSVVLFNGSDDASYQSYDLDGLSTDADGYFVLCGDAANVANCDLDVSPNTDLIQNGADAAALLVGDAVDFPNDTPVTTDNLVDAIVYDTDDGDDAGLLILLNAGQSQVNEDSESDKDNHSNQRCPDGSGGARNTDTYAQFTPTPGVANLCTTPPPPPPLPVTIYDIQFTTNPSGDSEYIDEYVQTEGIVTAVFQYGYFIEDPAGGAWNGLWVYDSNTPAMGDYVRLTGTVKEYGNLTEVDIVTSFEVLSSGNPLPDPVILATVDVSQEQWEGVLVRVENITVTNDDLGYGEWSVSDGSGDVVIDDKGSYTYSPANSDALDAVIGPLDYAYGAFKIQPRDDDDIVPAVVGPTYTSIYDIQYTLDPSGDSPYMDQTDITTEGIVTARFQYGYFIEDPAGGAWNGLWIHDTANAPVLGDRVRLSGTVIEYYNLTELDYLTSYDVLSSANPLPTPVVQPSGDVSQEMWEGVLVRLENVTVTNEDLGYGEWAASDGSGDVVIDDKGSYTYSPANGDALAAVIGPLDYAYGAFKIQPRDDDDIILPVPLPDIFINEVDADQVSTDSAEFVELYDGGIGNTDLTGLSIVLMNGSDDASYLAFDLDGQSTDGEGYFVVCGNAANVPNCDLDVSPDTNLIQNGADAVTLYLGDAADFPNDTPVTTDNLVDAIVYDTDDGDDAGLLVLLNAGQPQVNERGGGNGTGHSNQRCPDGSGGLRNTDSYTQFQPTPGATNCVMPIPDIVINEVDADQSGTDSAEFIELYDGGIGNTDLSGLSIVLMNGSDDASYLAFDLDGLSTDGDGYFVLCGNEATVANCDLDVSPDTNLIQNGADAVALIVGDAADFPNDTPITTDNLVDAIVYDTNDSDDAGLLVLLNAGQPQVNEGGGDGSTVDSNQRCPNGSGGARNTETFSQYIPTPGEENTCFRDCGHPATTFIYDVQGNGEVSPYNGTLGVTIEGVVVGDFQDISIQLKGFFLQEEDEDADDIHETSDGIFVYDNGFMDVSVGDVVRVKGSITEFYDLTEMNNVTNMAVCGTGTASAAPVTLPVSNVDVWEQYEGMLIHIPQTLYASDNYNQGRYGEVTLSVGDRLFNPTNVVTPGAEAIALQNLNDRSQIQLEDGSTAQNPLPLPPYIGLDNTLRAGDTLPSLMGVLHYNFGMYEVHPTGDVEFTRVNERPMEPPDVGGDITVASFNVLNYFTTVDDGSFICGPSGDMECRGADTVDEFQRQRDKIISAIVAMDADVIGLMEIENHPSDAAVQDLVNGLNDEAGVGTYAYVATGPVGTDAIKVAFIYKTGGVAPVEDFAILDSTIDPTFIDKKNRPALAQTFEEVGSGARFTAVVNHFKSKGSDCNDLGDPDTGDGQGNCNVTRTQAALALVNWLLTDPTSSGDSDFIIMGDLNAYAMEDPVAAILGAGYTNLVLEYEGAEAISYVYFGQAGYLDHALSNSSLTSQVQGAAVWHINADEPSALDYNDYNQPDLYTNEPYRASDHDPVLVGLNPNAAPVCGGAYSSVDLLWPANHKFVPVEILGVTDGDGDPFTITIDSIFQDELVDDGGDGNTWPDGQGIGTSIAEVRAERDADGNGRVYTITFTVDDGHGGTCSGEVLVGVPHDSGKKTEPPVDDGPLYDSTLEPEAMIVPEPTEEPSDKDKKDK